MSASASGPNELPLDSLERERDFEDMMEVAFAQLDVVALGVAVGVVSGIGLFFATAVLLIRGGQLVGLHLQGLGYYLPGYAVSWGGAMIGMVEIAIIGFGVGALLATIWNAYHRWFVALAVARETRRELQEL